MNEKNLTFTAAFAAFSRIDLEFREYALKHCEFKEKNPTPIAGFRRPIVCIRSAEQRVAIVNLINQWKVARDRLHEVEPLRFPLGAAMFNPEPKIISNIKHIQLYINTATNSRMIPAINILKRLERMRRSYLNKQEVCLYGATIEEVEKNIEYFKTSNDKFRLRSSGYTEVIMLIATKSEEYKAKVPDLGSFIEAENKDYDFILHQPDQAPQHKTRAKRFSVYDQLLPIRTIVPFTGDLYSENEIIAAKAQEEQIKKSQGYAR